MVVTVRGSAVREKYHDLVDRLGVLREVVPKHVGILQMRLRVPLLRVDKVRELGWIANEEHGCVVEHPIQVSLICLELDRKSTGVTSGIRRARLAADGRETDGGSNLFANRLEQVSGGNIADVVRHFKVAVSTCALGVDLETN